MGLGILIGVLGTLAVEGVTLIILALKDRGKKNGKES